MNISEIQSNLDQLKERHPDLDEGLISTLLEAGGWGKNEIKEAQMLFKLDSSKKYLPHEDEKFLPSPLDITLASNNISSKEIENIGKVYDEQLKKEGEVVKVSSNTENLIPHDLPLKPFEASPHVWPFFKYKDVFYGKENKEDDGSLELDEQEKKEAVPLVKEETLEEEISNKKNEPVLVTVPDISLTKTPLDKKDEGIVALGGMLALIVVLLILYMYSHGRL